MEKSASNHETLLYNEPSGKRSRLGFQDAKQRNSDLFNLTINPKTQITLHCVLVLVTFEQLWLRFVESALLSL